MAQAINNPLQWEGRRLNWLSRVESLVNQIEIWAKEQNWTVMRGRKTIHESVLGHYDVPVLTVRLAQGEIHVNPIGLNVIGADGRIDVEAFPSLNRVKVVGRDNQWEIYTDSNIPLRQPWNAQTFVQLAHDLLA